MLDLDRETFIAQYVTTYMATRAACPDAGRSIVEGVVYASPVDEAIGRARQAWCSLLATNMVRRSFND